MSDDPLAQKATKPAKPTYEEIVLRLAHDLGDGRNIDWESWRESHPELGAEIAGLRELDVMAGFFRQPAPGRSIPGPLEPGSRIGRFEIEEEAGRGGMGVVYRARDVRLGRPVGLKLLPSAVAHSPRRLERFVTEAKLLAAFSHPNLTTVHGLEEDDGTTFLVLEWVPGESLAERLARGPMSLRETLEVCAQIADGLAAAHEQKVIHRDLKPGNVMLTPDGRIKVLDFGLARSFEAALRNPDSASVTESVPVVLGTPGYLSPECLTGCEDHRADIFAFGCILYECLTATPAFPQTGSRTLAKSAGEADLSLLPDSVPPRVRSLIGACLERDHRKRLASIADASETICALLGRRGSALLMGLPTFPPVTTALVGRTSEIAACAAALAELRIVTFAGPGGVGKTRLALHLGAITNDNHPDGSWFVDLSPIRDPQRVPGEIASTMELPDEPGRPALDSICDKLKDSRALLVLDNCEQVRDACASVVGRLASSCPHLSILSTSREALGLPAERLFVLDPLPAPSNLDDPQELLRNESVRLFLDRLTPETALELQGADRLRTVGEICRRVDGLPLAIELAAARARVLSTEEIVARLDDQLRLLRESPASGRSRALRTSIERSVEQLPQQEAAVFRQAAVFVGGWSLEAANFVCPGSGSTADEFQTLDSISHLVDKSLVVVEHTPNQASRYRFLEPVRQYAHEALAESGELSEARNRHLYFCRELVEKAGPELTGPHAREWMARLDRDHENLLAALDWCETAADGTETALRITAPLVRYWITRGRLQIGEAALDRALARADTKDFAAGGVSELSYARTLFARGNVVLALGRPTVSRTPDFDPWALRRIFDRAMEHFHKVSDRRGVAGCLNAIGIEHNAHGDYERGHAALSEACAIYRELGEFSQLAGALNNLGLAAWIRRDLQEADRFINESRAIVHAAGDRRFELIMTVNLAFLAVRLGRLEDGSLRLREAIRLLDETGETFEPRIGALLAAAELAAAEQRWGRAARLFGCAEQQLEQIPVRLDGMPYWHEHDSCVELLQTRLGPDAYRLANEDGRSSSETAALEDAFSP